MARLELIEEMIREGLAERGEFNIREIDDAGKTVRVFGCPAPRLRGPRSPDAGEQLKTSG